MNTKFWKFIRLGFAVAAGACCVTATVWAAAELAKVNGKPITEHDLTRTLSTQYNEGMIDTILKDPNNHREILNSVIDRELVIEEAQRQKLDQSQQFKDALENAREQFLYQAVLQKVVSSKLNDSMVKKFYETHHELFNTDQLHAQHILVSDEQQARDILKKAKEPDADFQALAVKYSKDPSAKNNRGDLGFFGRGQMVQEFSAAAFSAKAGEIVGPVKTAFGYHIIKVVEKKLGKSLEFSDVEARARQMIQQDIVKKYLLNLREQAKVQIN